MPVMTSAAKEAQFVHVMDNLLQRASTTSPLFLALDKFHGQRSIARDVDNLLGMSDNDVQGLTYDDVTPDPNDPSKTITTERDLSKGDKAIIHTLLCFHLWKNRRGETIEPDKWTDVTPDEFRAYRVNEHWGVLASRPSYLSSASQHTASNATGGKTSTTYKTPQQIFDAGVKKDPSAYLVLKAEREFPDWMRHTKAHGS